MKIKTPHIILAACFALLLDVAAVYFSFPEIRYDSEKNKIKNFTLSQLEQYVSVRHNDKTYSTYIKQKSLDIYLKKMQEYSIPVMENAYWHTYCVCQIDLFIHRKKYSQAEELALKYLMKLESCNENFWSNEVNKIEICNFLIQISAWNKDRDKLKIYEKIYMESLEKLKTYYKKEHLYYEKNQKIYTEFKYNLFFLQQYTSYQMKNYKKTVDVTRQCDSWLALNKNQISVKEGEQTNDLFLMRSYQKMNDELNAKKYAERNITAGKKNLTMYLTCYEFLVSFFFREKRYDEALSLCSQVVSAGKNWKKIPPDDKKDQIYFCCYGIKCCLKTGDPEGVRTFLRIIKKNYSLLPLKEQAELFLFLLRYKLSGDWFFTPD